MRESPYATSYYEKTVQKLRFNQLVQVREGLEALPAGRPHCLTLAPDSELAMELAQVPAWVPVMDLFAHEGEQLR